MSRARWISLGALLLGARPPPVRPARRRRAGDGPPRRRRPSGQAPLTAGYGRVTPAVPARDRRSSSAGRAAQVSARTPARTLVGDLVRCAVFEGQRYCLGSGWTDRTQAQVQRQHWPRVADPPGRAADARDRHRRPLDDRRAPPGRPAQPRRPRRRPDRRADRGRPLGRQGLAAAPPDPGRARCRPTSSQRHPEVRAPAVATTAPARDRRPSSSRPRRRPAAVKHWADYPSRARPRPQDVTAPAPHLLVRPDLDADDHAGAGRATSASQQYWAHRSSARPPAARRSPRWSTS